MNPNQRKPNETPKAYRARLKAQQLVDKARSRGKLIWTSVEYVSVPDLRNNGARVMMKRVVQGTYVRKIHGPIGQRKAA